MVDRFEFARQRIGPGRGQRALAAQAVRAALVSVAGLVGRPVSNQAGDPVGRVVDLVVRYGPDEADAYPPLSGVIVQIGDRRSWVPASHVGAVQRDRVVLVSAKFDLREFNARPGEVLLVGQVMDRQLVDVDGRRLIRASDLYLADLAGVVRLVGVDVSVGTLLRRLGPRRLRTRPTPERVVDWAAIHPLGEAGGGVRLVDAARAFRALRPGELADLLEDLDRSGRRHLLDTLDSATVADAVEEMQADDVSALLRAIPTERAAALLAEMEPDEAVDALRDLSGPEREGMLRLLPVGRAKELGGLLGYAEDRAGGFMTTVLLVMRQTDTVRDVRTRLRERSEHLMELDRIVVVDDAGRVVDEVSMQELLLAEPEDTVASLVAPPWPVTVLPEATSAEVAERLVENRCGSVLVIDAENRPVGRILADDIVDVLLPDRGRLSLLHWAPQ
jgi:CBS domain-containing protein